MPGFILLCPKTSHLWNPLKHLVLINEDASLALCVDNPKGYLCHWTKHHLYHHHHHHHQEVPLLKSKKNHHCCRKKKGCGWRKAGKWYVCCRQGMGMGLFRERKWEERERRYWDLRGNSQLYFCYLFVVRSLRFVSAMCVSYTPHTMPKSFSFYFYLFLLIGFSCLITIKGVRGPVFR